MGYCLAASAIRENTRLIAVVMGTRSDEARARETQKLLAYGFRYYETRSLYEGGEVLQSADVWLGATDSVELGVEKPLSLKATCRTRRLPPANEKLEKSG